MEIPTLPPLLVEQHEVAGVLGEGGASVSGRLLEDDLVGAGLQVWQLSDCDHIVTASAELLGDRRRKVLVEKQAHAQ
ncbi:MAG TPA: hypothetical protein VFA92_09295 [Candidatus Binatia bacterium]|nr:hypothetical protein [Candidatus Binatia bacterium]